MKKLRHLLVVVLLLAVPVKGVFAAGMVLCAGHASVDAVASTAPNTHGHHHAPAGGDAHAGHSGHDDYGAPAEPLSGHGDVKCALCAACCIGGACLNSLPLPSLLIDGDDVAFLPVSNGVPPVRPDRLDRPPPRNLV